MRVLSPRRTAAASLLPPAVPAQTGMRLVREMRRSFQVCPVVRRKARAAATARLLLSLGRKRRPDSARTPPGKPRWRVTSSQRETDCITISISWYPSGRAPKMSRVRLILAGAERVSWFT